MTLDAQDIDAIANAVVSKLRVSATDADPRLSRLEAAKYLGVSPTTFDRLRLTEKLLRPVSQRPLRWSGKALDMHRAKGLREVIMAASS